MERQLKTGRLLSVLAVILAVGALAIACGGPKGPEEIPEQKMSLKLDGLLASVVIDMATGASGFKRVYTPDALRQAQRKPMSINIEDVNWDTVLNQAVAEAGIKWDWQLHEEEWIIWIHLSGEKWDPESDS